MEEENQEYLNSKLKSIIEPMIVQILTKQPTNIRVFMLNWLKQTYDRNDPSGDYQGSEVEHSFDVICIILQDDNDESVNLPKKSHKNIGRKGVSSEAHGDWNKKEDFKARVIPKTEDQKERLATKLKMSFMFNALTNDEFEIVLNAIEEKKYSKDDAVIKQGDDGAELYIVDSGTLACSRVFVNYVFFNRAPMKSHAS